MTNDVTTRLFYRGPAKQVCYELAEHDYSSILVPDAVYELPVELADRILHSNAHFEVAPPASSFKSGGLLVYAPKTSAEVEAGVSAVSVSESDSEKENQ